MALSINNLISSNSLFGTSNSTSSSSSIFGNAAGSGSTSILGDFASIKNGSYKKLLKSYYSQEKDATTELTETESKQTSMISSDMVDLKKAADALKNDNSLFEEGENGLDYDKLFKAVKDLTDAFNSAVDSTSEISITAIDKKMGYTASMLSKNSGLLEDVGIKLEDGKLSIDEAKFRNADAGKIKTLFQGVNSIAAKLSQRASDIYSISQTVLGKSTGLYTGTGARSTGSSAGSFWNTTL